MTDFIHSDVFDIGTAKWNDSLQSSMIAEADTSQFMLPMAENVSFVQNTFRAPSFVTSVESCGNI
jgi:hypothetical protein